MLGPVEVHNQMIAHQDMKPSNVLVYEKKKSSAQRILDDSHGKVIKSGMTPWRLPAT